MFTRAFKLPQITKSKFNTFNHQYYSNKFSFNKTFIESTKRNFCSKQQQEIIKSDSIPPKQQQKITKLNTASDILIDKYPWTSQLISASTGFIAYSGVIALNDCSSNSGLVDIIAHIGCIYSFGHLVGLTNTNFRDFINQTFMAAGALIAIIIFAFCYQLINPSDDSEKGAEGAKKFTINITHNKE